MIVNAEHFTHVRLSEWAWPSFKPAEIASRGDGSIAIESEAMDCLQLLRNRWGKPIIINSAYRDPIHNARVGGAPMSTHKLGLAFDLRLPVPGRHELYEWAKQNGFLGFGFYRTFLHVDLGRRRFWYGRGGKQFWKKTR